MIEILKLSFTIIILFYTCYLDIKTRKVSISVWKYMLVLSFPFVLYDLFKNSRLDLQYFQILLISVFIISVIAYLVCKFKKAFGCGDARGLIVLSILYPINPIYSLSTVTFPLFKLSPLFPFIFIVLENAILLLASASIILFCYNLLHLSPEMIKKPTYMFFGYKTKITSLKNNGYYYLLDKIMIKENEIIVKTFEQKGLSINTDLKEELEEYMKKGLIQNEIWITPSIPFMVFITIGFIIAITVGDIATIILPFVYNHLF